VRAARQHRNTTSGNTGDGGGKKREITGSG